MTVPMIEVAEAEALILENMPRFASGEEPLAACVGLVLAADVVAERDQPPFDRVTMDGIAIAYRDWAAGVRAFAVIGTQAAGAPALATAAPEQCVEVMTGAMLPGGTDTVVPVERVERHGDAAKVAPDAAVAARQFVHARGVDRKTGGVLLRAGTRIGPPEIAVLASAGCASVAVARRPRIAVISTGDELVGLDEPLAPEQIRSSNDWAIEASLTRHRLAAVTRTRLKDDASALADALRRIDDAADVLILSGGVSMGQFDFVPAVLAKLGAKLVFHRVRQRPGKPMWFGLSARGKPIFALPGNPVSTLVCTTRYVLPALRAASGLTREPTEVVTLAAPTEASPQLTYFMPVRLDWSAAGSGLAQPRPTNTSGDFVSLAGTDGFVELPARQGEHAAGTTARLFRW
jgi:molybdopterin molybdotransferase